MTTDATVGGGPVGGPVDKEIQLLLDFLAESGAPPMSEGTAEQARASFRALAVDLREPSALPDVDRVEEITVPGAAGPLDARVYRPHASDRLPAGPLPTIVMFHGGGWVIGDLDTHEIMARDLANGCAAVVVSVAYRLAPEHPFPAAADDAIAATAWAAEHLTELGGTEALAVAGDSAGGNLAAVAAQAMRDAGTPLAGQLLIYPGTDFTSQAPSRTENAEGYFLDEATITWFALQYLGADGSAHVDLTDPKLSPQHGRLDGLAPAVVVTAQYDPLRDDGVAYAEALAAAGVPVTAQTFPGLIHGFMDMGRYSGGARTAIAETCRLFRAVLHG